MVLRNGDGLSRIQSLAVASLEGSESKKELSAIFLLLRTTFMVQESRSLIH